MIKINNLNSGSPVETKTVFFGGGEKHVQLLDSPSAAEIIVYFENDSDVVTLAMYVDALKRIGCKNMVLKIPYFPGARQDRVCNTGEALSVKVYADMINAMNFDNVVIFDPHSDVTSAVLNNVTVVDNCEFVLDVIKQMDYLSSMQKSILVSPDAGSNKKISNVAKFLHKNSYHLPVVRADKVRDVTDGKIIETTVYADDLTDKEAYIIDDVCSKGGTFCALAKVLKQKGASKVYLVVSHFEGTANLKMLKESGIDMIFTTDSKPWAVNDYHIKSFIINMDVQRFMKNYE